MSLHLNFEPHSWYKGFAIQKTNIAKNDITDSPYNAYIDNGMTGYIDEVHATTIKELKSKITSYHIIEAQHREYNRRLIEDKEVMKGLPI